MKSILLLAAGLTLCTLGAKAQQQPQVVAQTTLGELDARNAAAAEQASRVDLHCALVYGFISPYAVIGNAWRDWMAERGCEQNPPPLEKLIAVNHRDISHDYNYDGKAFINFPGFSHPEQ
jgi:hypothetical protein